MMNSIEFIDKVSSGLWEDRFNVMMILFISKVLKLNDDGKGYIFLYTLFLYSIHLYI